VTAANVTSMTTVPYGWMISTVTVSDFYLGFWYSSAQVSVKLDLRHPNPEMLVVMLVDHMDMVFPWVITVQGPLCLVLTFM